MKKTNTQNLLLAAIVSIFSVFTISSCRKATQKENSSDTLVKKALEEKFFTMPAGTHPSVTRIAEELKKDNREHFFIDRVTKSAGVPIWDKSLIIGKKSASQIINRTATGSDTLLVFIPLSPVNTTEINGAFAGKIVGDSVVKINYIKESDYVKLGFGDSSKLNADNLISLLMYLQNSVFGTESFIVKDVRLFKDIKPLTTNKEKLIRFSSVNNESSSRIINSRLIEIEYCYKISGSNTGNKIAASIGQRCDTYSYWIEDYTLPSFNSGDGDGGGGNVGGGDSGGSNEGNTVISTQAILKEVLNLNVEQVTFLNTYAQLAEEIYNYINRGDGYLTFDECKAKAVSHISYCMESSVYFNFCQQKSRSFLLLNGWVIPWFHEASAGISHPELYSNIQLLKLDAKQAYTLLNFSKLNQSVSDLISKNFSDLTILDKELFVKEFLKEINNNQEFKEFVQSGYMDQAVIHPWMAALFKELALELGWKVISKYIPGYGDWQSIKDAIADAKDGDWLGALGEVLNIVKKKVPALAVVDAIVDVWNLSPLVNKAWKAFDKIRELPTNAFNSLLTTIKSKAGGLIGKFFHDDFNPGTSQSFLNVSPSHASSFFNEFANKLGKTINSTSSGGGWFDLDGIRVNFYLDASSQPHLPTLEFIFTSGKRYKIRFID